MDDIIQTAINHGVGAFYLPAIDSETHAAMLNLEELYPMLCHAMIGLHPCSVKENYKDELREVEKWLLQRRFVAIGEAGLDFYWDKTYVDEQYQALNQQMNWAIDSQIPIILHTRDAMAQTIDMVEPLVSRGLTGIFHCFGGSREDAQRIMDCGFYMGIGGVLTYKNAGLQEVVKDIPMDFLVLETDSPYLSPVPFRGKRNQPAYLENILHKLAEIKEMPIEEVARITTENAKKVFKAS